MELPFKDGNSFKYLAYLFLKLYIFSQLVVGILQAEMVALQATKFVEDTSQVIFVRLTEPDTKNEINPFLITS